MPPRVTRVLHRATNSSTAPSAVPSRGVTRHTGSADNIGTRYSRFAWIALPGDDPDASCDTRTFRWTGTNVGVSITIVFEPVPPCPATCQLSSMVQSDLGT